MKSYNIVFETTIEKIETTKILYEIFYLKKTFHIEGLYDGYTLTCDGKIVTDITAS